MTAGLTGAALLASLGAARALASASEAAVFLAGRELHWVCPFRHLFGVPCPSCGMTRSALMTLGGDIRGAMDLNPGGPLLVLGVTLFGALLLISTLRAPGNAPRKLSHWAYSYAAALAGVMLIRWMAVVV